LPYAIHTTFVIIQRVPLKLTRWILFFGLWLAACNGNVPSPTAPVVVTLLPPSAIPTLVPTETPPISIETATEALTPTETATPAGPAPCVNDAEFVRDLTIPDGAQFLPGQAFTKKWEVRNSGTCDWGPDYRLVLVSGDSLGAASEQALYPALAGRPATFEVAMTAPETPGTYTGRWQARDPESNLFGSVVFVTIEVISLPVTDTPTP
jgi:hypothetical protein